MRDRASTSEASLHEYYAHMPQLPWNIGGPQPAFVRLEEAGGIGHRVLDAGCGTGELVLFLAERGYQVVGVDLVGPALEMAAQSASSRDLEDRIQWIEGDLLHLDELEGLEAPFDTVVDSGTFQTFPDDQREAYVSQLAGILPPGGTYFMLCVSDEASTDLKGPRRTSQAEIREAFRHESGWTVESIESSRFHLNLPNAEASAWLARIRRSA